MNTETIKNFGVDPTEFYIRCYEENGPEGSHEAFDLLYELGQMDEVLEVAMLTDNFEILSDIIAEYTRKNKEIMQSEKQ